jgi:hypothetical protein
MHYSPAHTKQASLLKDPYPDDIGSPRRLRDLSLSRTTARVLREGSGRTDNRRHPALVTRIVDALGKVDVRHQ